jgi:hypothetical protein
MTKQPAAVLDRSRKDAGLTHNELWLRYFALGGMSSALQLEDILSGALDPTPYDHNVIAHALNERFAELGGSRSVAYTDDGEA